MIDVERIQNGGIKSVLIATFVVATALMFLWPGVVAQSEDPGVQRGLPERGDCGKVFEVSLEVSTPDDTDAWFVVEELPEVARFHDVDPAYNGDYDEERHRITWVSTNGDSATLTYSLVVDAEPGDEHLLAFTGEYRFDPHMDERLDSTGNQDLLIECIDLPGEEGTSQMVRSLPASARCGDTVEVTITVQATASTRAWALEEVPPEDAQVLDWTRDLHGDYNEETHLLKWLSLKANSTVLTYEFTIPEEVDGGSVLMFGSEKRFMPPQEGADEVLGDDQIKVVCGNWRTFVLGGGVAATALGLGLLVWRVRRPGLL